VTVLESSYAAFDGLNLTWETLEGLVKHNGPLSRPPAYIADYNSRHGLELGTHASAEAQVASLADDIAYHGHDLDDGMRAGLFGPADIAICRWCMRRCTPRGTRALTCLRRGCATRR